MKKLLFLLPLLLTAACSNVQLKHEPQKDAVIRYQPTDDFEKYRDVHAPVFMPFGPNAVGYSQIIETCTHDFNIIGRRATIYYVVDGEHRSAEGKILDVAKTYDIVILEAHVVFYVPALQAEFPLTAKLAFNVKDIDFILVDGSPIKEETK